MWRGRQRFRKPSLEVLPDTRPLHIVETSKAQILNVCCAQNDALHFKCFNIIVRSCVYTNPLLFRYSSRPNIPVLTPPQFEMIAPPAAFFVLLLEISLAPALPTNTTTQNQDTEDSVGWSAADTIALLVGLICFVASAIGPRIKRRLCQWRKSAAARAFARIQTLKSG